MKHIFLFILLINYFLPIWAQQRCGVETKSRLHLHLHTTLESEIDDGLALYNRKAKEAVNNSTEVLTIPVHVIIVHDPQNDIGVGDNHSLNKILSQIAVLNQDFTRTNADSVNTPVVFSAESANIKFCLASQDPEGNPTDGVTRYATNVNFDDEEFEIKSATRWPRESYLNLWVADISDLGYSYIPSTTSLPNEILDGVVIDHVVFGGPNTGAVMPYDRGRTATHEVGHYLGLRHIWRVNGCTIDDDMADTPLQDKANTGCKTHPSPSCNNTGDMFMNYMDYSDDACMNAFTSNQVNYMRSILNGIRFSILSSGLTQCKIPLNLALIEKINVKCFGESTGIIRVQANGGVLPYTYSIQNVASNSDGIFTQLPSGSYNIKVVDAENVVKQINVELTQSSQLIFDQLTISNNLCFDDMNGKISTAAIGGLPFSDNSYFYSINNSNFVKSGIFDSLANGNYNLRVIDANDCIVEQTVLVQSPPRLELSLEQIKTLTCYNDSDAILNFNAIGGQPPYVFVLNGNESNIPTFTNLKSGGYFGVVYDVNLCNVVATSVIEQGQVILADLLMRSPSCYGGNDGEIAVTPKSGSPPFKYALDGQNFQVDSVFRSLNSGNYSIDIMDHNNCKSSLLVGLTQPDSLIIESFTISQNGDNTFNLMINASGGVKPYHYFIIDANNVQEEKEFKKVVEGNYLIGLIDQNGCKFETYILVTSNKEISKSDEFEIVPNPFSDKLTINYIGENVEVLNVRIYDMTGSIILTDSNIILNKNENLFNINTSTLPQSMMILNIESGTRSYFYKIVKY